MRVVQVDDASSVAEREPGSDTGPRTGPHTGPHTGRARRWRGAGTGALLLLVFVALPIGLVALQAS